LFCRRLSCLGGGSAFFRLPHTEYSDPVLRGHFLRLDRHLCEGSYGKGAFCATAARQKLLEFCPTETLRLLNCELPRSASYSGWLGALVHAKQQTISPVRHLLVMAWLGKPLDAFLSTERVADPLKVSFPCLNVICDSFGQTVSNTVEFRASKRLRILKVYRCPACFHASTRTPCLSEAVRVVDFGRTWGEKLRMLWNDPKISLCEIRQVSWQTLRRSAVEPRRLGYISRECTKARSPLFDRVSKHREDQHPKRNERREKQNG
jgi:hypothetical protein